MKKIHILLFLLLTLSFSSCVITMTKVRTWLETQRGVSEIQIQGKWYSEQFGNTFIDQNGSSISGTIGNYYIEGVINKNIVIMAITSKNLFQYLAVVEMKDDYMSGDYTGEFKYRDPSLGYNWGPISFVREK
jgi:hypothetical protein